MGSAVSSRMAGRGVRRERQRFTGDRAWALTLGILAYTLAATALLEGVITLVIRAPLSRQAGVLAGIHILTIAMAILAALNGLPHSTPNYPLITACAAGFALGLMYALSGLLTRVTAWGVVGGLFALVGAFPVFAAMTPLELLYRADDTLPNALTQLPSQYAAFVLGLAVVGIALRFVAPAGSRLRRLRVAAQVVALIGGLIGALTLFGHSGQYSAVIMGLYAVSALVVGWIERRPLPAGIVAAFFGSIAAVVFISVAPNALAVVAIAPAIALAALVIYGVAGRAYALPVYAVSLLGVIAAFLRLSQPPAGLPDAVAHFALGPGGLVALVVAGLMTIAALRERSALWQIAPAGLACLSLLASNDLWPMVVITLGLAGAGALARWRRGPGQGAAWQGAALLASFGTVLYTIRGVHGGPDRAVVIALVFLVVAWLVAWQERQSWLTLIATPYALVAFWEIGALALDSQVKLAITVALTLALAGIGALARARLGRPWALVFYVMAVVGSLFTVPRVAPYPAQAGLLEAILLLYAAIAFAVALLEERSWAAVVPGDLCGGSGGRAAGWAGVAPSGAWAGGGGVRGVTDAWRALGAAALWRGDGCGGSVKLAEPGDTNLRAGGARDAGACGMAACGAGVTPGWNCGRIYVRISGHPRRGTGAGLAEVADRTDLRCAGVDRESVRIRMGAYSVATGAIWSVARDLRTLARRAG